MDQVEKLIHDMLNEVLPSAAFDTVETIIDVGSAVVPPLSTIGSIMKSHSIRKLKKRLDKAEPELRALKTKIEASEYETFYKQELFPLILNYICEEDEDEKVSIYINGFEYTIDQGIAELETVFHYYDVLAELRISDMVRLFNQYIPKRHDKLELKLNLRDFVKYENDPKYRDEWNAKEDITKYIDNKLIRLGLVIIDKHDGLKNLEEALSSPNRRTRRRDTEYKLTRFGNRFVKFFSEKEE